MGREKGNYIIHRRFPGRVLEDQKLGDKGEEGGEIQVVGTAVWGQKEA